MSEERLVGGDRHQPDRCLPGHQAGHRQDDQASGGAGSSSSPPWGPSSARPDRPTTPPPRQAWWAWPAPSPGRWPAARSPSTSSPRAWSIRICSPNSGKNRPRAVRIAGALGSDRPVPRRSPTVVGFLASEGAGVRHRRRPPGRRRPGDGPGDRAGRQHDEKNGPTCSKTKESHREQSQVDNDEAFEKFKESARWRCSRCPPTR